MKKIFLFLLFLLFLLPISVLAKDTCDPSNIKIESITLEDTKGNIEEVKEASSSGQKINLGLRMNVVGDTASYKIVLKNTSNEDYYFDEKSLNLDTDYVDYEVSYEDDNNLIKSGEEKILFLKVVYKEKMDSSTLENGLYQDTQVFKLNLTNNNLVEEILENPVTGSRFGIIVFIILIIGLLLFFMGKRKSVYLFLLVGFTLPFSVHALCRHSLEIENELVIDTKEAIFLPGEEVNVKMKQLAGDDTSTVTNGYAFKDENIKAIKYSEVEPSEANKEEKNIVSTPESGYPIYMWFDDGTIYWWSKDITPSLNEDSFKMFSFLWSLNNMAGLEHFDTSNVKRMEMMFQSSKLHNLDSLSKWNTTNVENISGIFAASTIDDIGGIEGWDVSNVKKINLIFSLSKVKNFKKIANWNTSNVEEMTFAFAYCNSLESLEGLENWNVSNVTKMDGLFWNTSSIRSLNLLRNWNVSKVEDLTSAFSGMTNLESLSGLENWDVSNVIKLTGTFNKAGKVTNLDALQKWNTSNVKDMWGVFWDMSSLTDINGIADWDVSKAESLGGVFACTDGVVCKLSDISPLQNWNTSSATEIKAMFQNQVELNDISPISEWNVSNVKDFSLMFYKNKIEDASSINNWNIHKDANFERMFSGALSHPEFSKVQGTWNNGTFIPTE